MKKLLWLVSGLTALSALAMFAFYFFKLNPQYMPCKCGTKSDDDGCCCGDECNCD